MKKSSIFLFLIFSLCYTMLFSLPALTLQAATTTVSKTTTASKSTTASKATTASKSTTASKTTTTSKSTTASKATTTASKTQTTTGQSLQGVWFSYEDFQTYLKKTKTNNATNFRNYFKKVISNCKSKKLNCIIVQVRPTGDALYKSSYFPTSAYIAGKQGAALSYDPLKIMVEEAHKQNIRIEAWINPYRVAFSTDYKKLSANNQARKWHNSASTTRNVLSYGGKLYYNPSKPAVRALIINGVKEIVKNYDIDGIHMDDYFYPEFSALNYKKVFDAKEYNASAEKKAGMTIDNYRRKQVDLLVKGIKQAIKAIDSSVTFGISPAGNIDNLTSKYKYYVNIKKWMTSTEYVDYIAPQVYWGFCHTYAKFNLVVDRWVSMTNQAKVKLYIGLPAYRMNSSYASCKAELKEFKSATLITKMVQYSQKKKTNGFILFDYADLGKKSITNLVNYLKK